MGCFFVPLSKLPWKRVFYYYLGMGRPADQEGQPQKREFVTIPRRMGVPHHGGR